MILFVSLHEKQKINHGKFPVEVPEYLKIAAHQCKLQYTKSNLQESVSHVINALSLNYILCDNFTFKLANMFLKELLSSKNFLSYKMTGNEKLTWQIQYYRSLLFLVSLLNTFSEIYGKFYNLRRCVSIKPFSSLRLLSCSSMVRRESKKIFRLRDSLLIWCLCICQKRWIRCYGFSEKKNDCIISFILKKMRTKRQHKQYSHCF